MGLCVLAWLGVPKYLVQPLGMYNIYVSSSRGEATRELTLLWLLVLHVSLSLVAYLSLPLSLSPSLFLCYLCVACLSFPRCLPVIVTLSFSPSLFLGYSYRMSLSLLVASLSLSLSLCLARERERMTERQREREMCNTRGKKRE